MALWQVNPDLPGQDIKLTFQDLSLASQKAANLLTTVGAGRVGCFLPRLPEWWITNLATIRAGIVMVPGNAKRTQQEILSRILAAEIDCIIGDWGVAEKVDNIPTNVLGNVKTKIMVGGEKEETGWLSWEKLMESSSDTFPVVRSDKDDVMQVITF